MKSKHKLLFIGLEYALDNYFSNHYAVLSDYQIQKYRIDKDAPTSWLYSRRSVILLPIEFALVFFYLIFNRPKYIVSVGPKVGLLASICAKILFIENVHWFTGQVWANKKYRGLAFYSDLMISKLSSHICADSHGQAVFIEEHLKVQKGSIRVPQYGSINGLDKKYFCNRNINVLPDSNKLVFIGRITEDKGVFCLLKLAKKLKLNNSKLEVEFYGQIDEYFNCKKDFLDQVSELENVRFYNGFVNPIDIFSDAFLLILPSYREGFGSILIEAQSKGVPVVCSDIYGVSDSLIHEKTGFLCPVDDVDCFYQKVSLLENDTDLWRKIAEDAIEFSNRFETENFRQSIAELYYKIGFLE